MKFKLFPTFDIKNKNCATCDRVNLLHDTNIPYLYSITNPYFKDTDMLFCSNACATSHYEKALKDD